jgi:N-acetylgalactosamine kinase
VNTSSAPLYSLILAAGKGRRMRSHDLHKVCFEIDGVPAIHRALDVYNRLGVVRNVVVVGDLAGQVVEMVGRRYPNVVFAFQPEARGTGDAVQCGLPALAEIPAHARILVVAGDKLVDGPVLERLLKRCQDQDADLGMVVSPASWGGESAGRVLTNAEGRPLAIVEAPDIRMRQCRSRLRHLVASLPDTELTVDRIQQVIAEDLGGKGAYARVIPGGPDPDGAGVYPRGPLVDALERSETDFEPIPGKDRISAEEAWHAPWRNEFVYLVRMGALQAGLQHMQAANAQGESYLTDAIGAICTSRRPDRQEDQYRVVLEPTIHPHEVLSYNNPEELLLIEDHLHGRRRHSESTLRGRLGTARLKRVADWQRLFPVAGPLPDPSRQLLAECYGDDPAIIADRARALGRVLAEFAGRHGEEREVVVVRSPGRINLMGRHIDWQGGHCNLMAVSQEVLLVAGPRSDDIIEAHNVDPIAFPPVRTSLGQMVSRLDWDDWLSVVNSRQLHRHLRELSGNWRLYIEAALLRLQMAFRSQALQGMDMVVLGNIPIAAGLSSSSAIVVASAEAAVALNGLEVTSQQFVNFCGEGEWFVGTRGGSADHAAMKFGRNGTINHVAFHPFRLLQQLQFPPEYRLVVANSLVQARKATGARAAFNSRVGSYLVGLELIRRRFPRQAAFIQYVRDLDPAHLQVSPAWIYQMLLTLPVSLTAGEIRSQFAGDPDAWSRLEAHFGSVSPETTFPVRGVVMFGVAECARARQAATLLTRGDMVSLGELMRLSHDGERCYRTRRGQPTQPFEVDISDAALQARIDDLESHDPARQDAARLELQPGGYRCSTEEIDQLVDLASEVPGVLGAQIAGAGLGGCAMILVEAAQVATLCQHLEEHYYDLRGLPRSLLLCQASAGSGLLSLEATH